MTPAMDMLERLSAYLDGELSAPQAEALERELERDAALRASLNELKRLSNGMHIEDADRRAAQAIRADLRRRLAGRRAARSPRWWWSGAAGAAALLALALFVVRAPAPSSGGAMAVHVDAVAQQYSLALDELAGGQP